MDRKTRQRHESLAHTLEYVLGKAPDEFGLVLDPEGWIGLKQLVQALNEEEEWKGVNASRISDLEWALPEAPLEIEEKRIRLKPDHPTASPPLRESAPLPSVLYFGCRRKPYRVYRREGISPPPDGEIVVSREKELALRMASRRDPKPILVEVSTSTAVEEGSRFFSYGQQLFVVDVLSPESLSGPPLKEEAAPPKPRRKKEAIEKAAPQPPHPDSFHTRPWNPEEDPLVARDTEEDRKKLRRERSRKRVGWKDEARRDRRRGIKKQ